MDCVYKPVWLPWVLNDPEGALARAGLAGPLYDVGDDMCGGLYDPCCPGMGGLNVPDGPREGG